MDLITIFRPSITDFHKNCAIQVSASGSHSKASHWILSRLLQLRTELMTPLWVWNCDCRWWRAALGAKRSRWRFRMADKTTIDSDTRTIKVVEQCWTNILAPNQLINRESLALQTVGSTTCGQKHNVGADGLASQGQPGVAIFCSCPERWKTARELTEGSNDDGIAM